MTLSFVALAAVPVGARNTKIFELTIKLEHGDADSYSETGLTAREGDTAFLELVVKYLLAYEDEDQYSMGELGKLRELANKLKITENQFWRVLDLIDRDHHYTDQYARVDRWHIRYFNEHGDEYFVGVYDEGGTKLR